MNKEEFIKHKMKILVGKEGYDRKQAYSIALSMFENKHKAQQGGQVAPQYYNTYNPYFTPTPGTVPTQNVPTQQDVMGYTNYLPGDYNLDGVVDEKDKTDKFGQPVKTQPTAAQQTPNVRYNIFQPYGGVDLDAALAYTGQGFGAGNPWQAGIGTATTLLKGARNFLGGFASGKENARVTNQYYDTLYNPDINYVPAQQGGEVVTNADMLTGQFVADQPNSNLNAEHGEFIQRAATGNVQEIIGEPHIKNGQKADGVNIVANEGDKILSNYTKVPTNKIKELNEKYDLKIKKGDTFADVQKAHDKSLGIEKVTDELASQLEKLEENEKVQDTTTKRLNELNITKEIERTKAKLDALKEPQSMIFDELFSAQESLDKKGDGTQLFDENGKEVAQQGGMIKKNQYYQEGGLLDEIAQKYGISPERAHELLTMQEGGQMEAPQQQAEGSQEQQIIQAFAQAQGVDPQEIVRQLQQMQPEEQQQALAQMMQALQGGGQEQAQGGADQIMQYVAQAIEQGTSSDDIVGELVQQGVPQEEAVQIVTQVSQQEMAQEGGTYSFATQYTPKIEGYNVTGSSILNQPTLSDVEYMQPYMKGKGYGAKMADVENTINTHSWYFNTEEKKKEFREAAKKEGQQKPIVEFQNAYNQELRKRAKDAGLEQKEINNIVNEVGFSGRGVQQFDGKFGAFTSTRPLFDFKKTDGTAEIIPTKIPKAALNAPENVTKTVLPWLPQDLKVFPSSLAPLAKEQISLERLQPTKQTVEPYLAEQERQRQADIERVQATGLSPQQQEALLAQGLSSSQMASNDAIAKIEAANAANQMAVNQFNIGQRSKEDLSSAQFNKLYQDQMLQSLSNQERDLRRYFNEANLQNRQSYKDIENLNILNAMQENYQYLPGAGIQYLPSQKTDLSLGHLTQEELARMTPQERLEYEKRYSEAAKVNQGYSNFVNNKKKFGQ